MRVIDLTLEELIEAMTIAMTKVIDEKFASKVLQKDNENDIHYLTINEAAEYISLSLPTIYGMTSRKEIPHIKKGKRLYFIKKDLNEFLENGRNKTKYEIFDNATKSINSFLSKTK